MNKTTLAISCGDPNGIGIEVALKAFRDARLFAYFTPVLYASEAVVRTHVEACGLEDVPVTFLASAPSASVRADAAPAPASAADGGPSDPEEEVLDEAAGLTKRSDGDRDGDGATVEHGAPPTADDRDDGSPVSAPSPLPIDPQAEVVYVVDCFSDSGIEVEVEFGRVTAESGAAAKTSLDAATAALEAGQADALVTAPIHKSAMQQSSFGFPGHTEYLQERFGRQGRSLMLMVGEEGLRVAVATNHVPLRQVASGISPTILQHKIAMLHESLERDFGVHGPLIAVPGLNPHAGDEGAIGSEEVQTIRPAVEAMKLKGMEVFGPYPADGFFGSGRYRDFDGVLAMYHDQGLVPFKTLAFGGGVNFTAGLRVVRTSPDHGTALDIAGRGEASPESFRQAAFVAREVSLARQGYDEAHANPLKRRFVERRGKKGKGKRPARKG